MLCITENNEVSSANNLALRDNSSASSFMYIKKVTVLVLSLVPALTLVHVKTYPFKTTVCSLLLKKFHNKFKSSPDVPFCFNLKIIHLCHTLSNAFDITKKTLLASNLSSHDLYISFVIEKNWLK